MEEPITDTKQWIVGGNKTIVARGLWLLSARAETKPAPGSASPRAAGTMLGWGRGDNSGGMSPAGTTGFTSGDDRHATAARLDDDFAAVNALLTRAQWGAIAQWQ